MHPFVCEDYWFLRMPFVHAEREKLKDIFLEFP